MAFLNMDLTGSNETYRDSNVIFKIVKYGQIVHFGTPVFADSLVVQLVSSGTNRHMLTENQDYIIPEDAISSCDNDLSDACIREPSFDKQLINGIQMIRAVAEPANEDDDTSYLIAVTYQRLYPREIGVNYYENDAPLKFTPEVLREMLSKIATHDVLLNRVTDVTSSTIKSNILLEVDTTGTNPNNKITNERHLVNVSTKQFVIHPHAGLFYGASLKITHPSTGTTLERDRDYILLGMDAAATKATSSTDTVWNFIAITSSVYDEIVIEYQAFGGSPTLTNYKTILDSVLSITAYLNNAKNVTADTMANTPVISSLCNRIGNLEAEMRRLLGTPTYGDSTSGKSILMSIASEQAGLHWYTIASLYKVQTVTGPSPVASADTFVFRLQSSQTHFQFTCSVCVDLTNQHGDVLNCSVQSENYPRGYISFNDYTRVESIIRPQLRVVWNNSNSTSGAYLQLGIDLKTVNKEVMTITDCSGQESAWKLVDEIDAITTPSDTDFVLPDEVSSWSDLSAISKQESMLIPFHKGHLLWCGNITMNRPLGGWKSTILSDELLIKEDIDITRIRKLRLNIQEDRGNQFAIDIPFSPDTNALKGHSSFTHQEQPAYINVEIYRDRQNDSKLTVDINYQIVAGESSTIISIKDMVIFMHQ